jgi:hypothetical protein
MKKNVGSYDGAVRFVAGCGLLMLGNHGFGWWGLLGLIPILSTVTGTCFVYAVLGIDTTACDRVAHVSSHQRRPRAHARLLQ